MMHMNHVTKHREVWGTCSWAQDLPSARLQEPLRVVSWDLGRKGARLGASAGIGAPGAKASLLHSPESSYLRGISHPGGVCQYCLLGFCTPLPWDLK